jgi:imidazolonepropionase-like amidohydrolase
VDQEAAEIVAARGAYAVPTMATIFALLEDGERLGFPPVSIAKLKRLADRALSSLEILRRAGVKMGFGTDLLGPQHVRQSTEFALRARVLSPLEILRSVCSVNAELLNQAGQLGCIREGASADLLVVDGDPLSDVSVLAQPENLRVIMQAGRVHKQSI